MRHEQGNENLVALAGTPEGVTSPEQEHHARRPSERQPQGRQHAAAGSSEFEAREAKMRAASAERWVEDELFNLKNAFDLQLKRLEVRKAEVNTMTQASTRASRRLGFSPLPAFFKTLACNTLKYGEGISGPDRALYLKVPTASEYLSNFSVMAVF